MVIKVSTGRWLYVAQSVATPPDGSNTGEVIRWYRQHAGMTQQEAAVVLNTTQSRLSKIETGSLTLGIDELRFIAGELSIPFEELGILPERSPGVIPQAGDFRIFATAVALFPLTLWVELLTIAVIEGPVFDQLFGRMVGINDEGAAVSTEAGRPAVGVPFTSETCERLRSEPLSPIARACIAQAWQHRHLLLTC